MNDATRRARLQAKPTRKLFPLWENRMNEGSALLSGGDGFPPWENRIEAARIIAVLEDAGIPSYVNEDGAENLN